jgi:PAS domain-containing protein
MRDVLLRSIGAALDGLDVGFCAFDSRDCALAWNDSFLALFPEHRGHVHKGEPYAENLRRFYAGRLQGDEATLIERYVAEGIGRHRAQRRPYEFDHLGGRVRVSSMPLGSMGRVRVWRRVAPVPAAADPRVPPAPAELAGLALRFVEHSSDGMLVVDPADRVQWANAAFLQLYGVCGLDEAVGQPFEALYRRAWRSTPHAPEFLRYIEVLRENQRFAGAPFDLLLPGDRWVRVTEHRGGVADGRGLLVHQDISQVKRLQQRLDAAGLAAAAGPCTDQPVCA